MSDGKEQDWRLEAGLCVGEQADGWIGVSTVSEDLCVRHQYLPGNILCRRDIEKAWGQDSLAGKCHLASIRVSDSSVGLSSASRWTASLNHKGDVTVDLWLQGSLVAIVLVFETAGLASNLLCS